MTTNQSLETAPFLNSGRQEMEKVGVRPIGNNILCEQLPNPEQSSGGIILIKPEQKETARYRVISMSCGWRTARNVLVAFECRPGDVIIGDARAPDIMRLGQRKLKLLKNHEVIAVEQQA